MESRQDKLNSLIQISTQTFGIDYEAYVDFKFYPFSNEEGFWKVLKGLNRIQINDFKNNKIKVALLVGPSYLLSCLPELSKIADCIFIVDIQPNLHRHNEYLLECFKHSHTPQEYINYYYLNVQNKLAFYTEEDALTFSPARLAAYFRGKESIDQKRSLQKYYFLHDQARFDECKKAANQATIIPIQVDLTNTESCQELANILEMYDAIFTLCNLTNIHHYNENKSLSYSIPALLKNSPDCLLMFATGPITDLRTTLSTQLKDYYDAAQLPFPAEPQVSSSTFSLFSFRKKQLEIEKTHDHMSYIGFFNSKTKDPTSQKTIEGIMMGEDINRYCQFLHAYASEKDAEAYILSKIDNNKRAESNMYWIFKVRGHHTKINKFLKCSDIENDLHHDSFDNKTEISSLFSEKIINVSNNDRNIVLKNEYNESDLTLQYPGSSLKLINTR